VKPSQDEINKTIEQLREIKPKVRHKSLFGDDNRAAIGAQIEVLENNLSEDGIFDRWPSPDDDISIREAALTAREWLDGKEIEEGLVEAWQTLVVS
jgi:hypothetical protein